MNRMPCTAWGAGIFETELRNFAKLTELNRASSHSVKEPLI